VQLSEGEAIGIIDRFALQHRLPNGKTVLDQFLTDRPSLTAADRGNEELWSFTMKNGAVRARR
jgi:hypothetical protein